MVYAMHAVIIKQKKKEYYELNKDIIKQKRTANQNLL
jgi:hypothetical protein